MLGLAYTIQNIAEAVFAKDLFQGAETQIPLQYVAFDTRTIIHGEQTLFVALKTAHRDGHDFVAQAIEKGVQNFLVQKNIDFPNINYALVENTLDALQMWAKFHREKFTYPVIGITGSNGKTIVKEWLTTLLEGQFQIVKSPMSYNSQLGVALSLLQMRPNIDAAIIEAGISKVGEMAILAEMIQPTLGILTHIGTAHSEGFVNEKQKIEEKLTLFATAQKVIVSSEQSAIFPILTAKNITFQATPPLPDYSVLHKEFLTAADKENASLAAFSALIFFGMTEAALEQRLSLLHPVQMRTEMISENPQITLINDTYNSDIDSIFNAFQLLQNTKAQPHKKLILSDLSHLGKDQIGIQSNLLKQAEKMFEQENVITIGEVFAKIRNNAFSFLSTQDFTQHFHYQDYIGSVVLFKGARQFQLETLLPLFHHKLTATVFKVNLNALVHNLRYFRSLVPIQTKIMCMVKAFSYGSGTWEIASALQQEGADYLAVAYSSEAIELREKGISLPIMVMNPDAQSLETLVKYEIEPEIYDFTLLEKYIRAARLAGLATYPIHLKFDTGMGRLGFNENDISHLIEILTQYPDIQVVSMLTHLAAADDSTADDFSLQQIARFQAIYTKLHNTLGISPLRHALNSAGILRFPQFAMDMVRLGIGLYGVNPTEDSHDLQEIGTLQTLISQIHSYPTGTSVGYGRSQFTTKDSRIATLPIGYADGIFRRLGNGKVSFYVKGKPAPTFGRVCMDMLMIDVSDIPEAKAGDEVLIFGKMNDVSQSVSILAQAAETISYEILTSISPRVKRVYINDNQ